MSASRTGAGAPGRPRRAVGLGLAALWLGGCITVSEFRALERDVGQLKARQGGAVSASDGRVAELGAELDDVRLELGRLRGEVEELRRIASEAREGAQQRPQVSGGSETPPSTGMAPVAPLATQEVREYEEAFRYYRETDYTTAIDRFRAFLQNHPSSDYADNAMFWMGESYFRSGDFERAVLTFEDVVNRYPDGNKVPDALYRQGIALLQLGERDAEQGTYESAAREIFDRIVNEYPQSERVGEARRQLEKLSR